MFERLRRARERKPGDRRARNFGNEQQVSRQPERLRPEGRLQPGDVRHVV